MSMPLSTLLSIGLSEQKAKETIKNESLTTYIYNLIEEVQRQGGNLSQAGPLIYHLATRLKPQIKQHVPFVISYIISNKIDSTLRVEAAVAFLSSDVHSEIDKIAFENACGIGVIVTPEDVESAVEQAISKYRSEIIAKRYRFNTGPLLQDIRKLLKWADFKDVKNEVDVQMLDILGPKTDDDRQPLVKKKTKAKAETTNKSATNIENTKTDVLTISDMISKLGLHKPGENFQTDGYIVTPNTKSLLSKHKEETCGQVRTRFPPEPNGVLHIGHAKAININFGYAQYHKGICFLRFDDTNPEKEEDKFFKGIMDMVHWLGYKPFKTTHSSDYFDQLYEWAIDLIKKGLAYVCHQKQAEMQGFNPPPSPWRNRSIEENLLLFQDMKNGKMSEGECTLRMKITLEEGKQDPVAYRIKYVPHPRSGDKWCIYPTYDYTHCLCDSIENITHSLCTKEFQSRRYSYYWLCNALNVYCPVQWEYGRLNMNYTVVSKRKIAKLIETKIVNDWDDPRLFTLTALRRRGFPPEAINRFCAQMGVTGAQTVVDPIALDACVRDVLNITAPRTMVVIDPLEVEIISGCDCDEILTVPDFPSDLEKSFHNILFSPNLYIEQDDFKEHSESGFKRLTMDQSVGLRYTSYLIKVKDIIYMDDKKSVIKKLKVTAHVLTKENKPKAFIHWVSNKCCEATVRLYSNLFNHKNPEDPNEVPNGYLSDINPNSLTEKTAFVDKSLLDKHEPFIQYQFERLGYFSIDPDSTKSHLVFNQTVLLREDMGK